MTPDGKTLAAGSGNVIQLSDIETGKELRTIPGPASGLAGLLFSPDGRTLAGRATNGVVFVWATNTGNEMHQLKPVPREASNEFVLILGGGRADAPGMAFTPDSKTLAAAVTDYEKQKAIHSVKFWDMASGKETRKIKAPEGVSVSAVAISASGKILAYGAGNDLHLCEAETGKEIRRLTAPDGGILAVVISPNDKTVAVRGRNQRIRLWDIEAGKELHQLSDAEPAQRVGGMSGGLMFLNDNLSAPESRVLSHIPRWQQGRLGCGSDSSPMGPGHGQGIVFAGRPSTAAFCHHRVQGRRGRWFPGDQIGWSSAGRWRPASLSSLSLRRREPRWQPSPPMDERSHSPTRITPSACTTRPQARS